MEQCSSELTANYKAALAPGGSLIDMTGGMGVDAAAFARRCTAVTFIERQPEVADVARHNFPLLGLRNIGVVCGDSTELLAALYGLTLIYLTLTLYRQISSRIINHSPSKEETHHEKTGNPLE